MGKIAGDMPVHQGRWGGALGGVAGPRLAAVSVFGLDDPHHACSHPQSL